MSSGTVMSLQALQGHIVPKRFSPSYIVLSYLVSYLGSWTTLELINRRTALRGTHNWLLLLSASISMGGIAIWCMHFLGNRAIILGDGSEALQISYAPSFTAISFFVPVVVLFLAFSVVGSDDKISTCRIAIGGILSGLGIVGMHYLGQAGISDYECIYETPKVVGAVIIAVTASTAALIVFFRWRSAWETSWWKRASCAIVLAGAVSGMHWLASVGTSYRFKEFATNDPATFSRNATAIVVLVLSLSGCMILLALTIVAQRRHLKMAVRAEQVILSIAAYDEEGRLLVTPEGLLPTRKITDTFMERSFNDTFCISHPVFLWIFRASRYWQNIAPLLPGMQRHIHQSGVKNSRPATRVEHDPELDQDQLTDDYSILFRELFCIAAAELANDLAIPLEDVGVLHDFIVSTGRRSNPIYKKGRTDVEKQMTASYAGKGQLLFLAQQVSPRRAENLQAAGYRFADIHNVLPILSRSMRIEANVISNQLKSIRKYTENTTDLKPGVHMALFAVRAAVTGGFDILVRQEARNQLPTIQMPWDSLSPEQLDYLKIMNSMNTSDCMEYLQHTIEAAAPEEVQFASFLMEALRTLRELIHMIPNDAILVSQPIEVPVQKTDDGRSTATLIVFRLMAPIHSRSLWLQLLFVPLNFFKMQQRLYEGSPDHAVFQRQLHREFSGNRDLQSSPTPGGTSTADIRGSMMKVDKLLSRDSLRTPGKRTIRTRSMPHLPRPQAARLHRIIRRDRHEEDLSLRKMKSHTSSETGLVDYHPLRQHSFGGIMISQEVTVNVKSEKTKAALEMEEVLADEARRRETDAITSLVTNIAVEGEARTYVDVLFDMFLEKK